MPKLGVTKEELERALRKAKEDSNLLCEMQGTIHDRITCKLGVKHAVERVEIELGRKVSVGGIAALGIIISPDEACPKGFEAVTVKSKLNPRVKICRLGPGYRKLEPEERPVGTPLRRRVEFSPGIAPHRERVRPKGRFGPIEPRKKA